MTQDHLLQTHTETVQSHWWWRPGWHQGRRFYTWHLTFEGQHDFHQLVTEYQAQLADVPGVDLVPLEWLHLTIQGVGFTDEVSDADLDQVVTFVRRQLANLPSGLRVTFNRALVRNEAVALPPSPLEEVTEVRTAIREALADVWGVEHVPEPVTGFQPHVSLAYLDTNGPSTPFIEAIEKVRPQPVTIGASEAALIILNRDDRMYKWQTHARTNINQSILD